MIPICLVTGFLGSGKTTLLRRIVSAHHDRRLVYIVNEFASQDMDGALVRAEEAEVVAIPGGSIFCQCLVADFIRHLTSIPERFGTAGIEGVVIEASGVANPEVVQRMLMESTLDATYTLALIVTVTDPRTLPRLARSMPSIRAQVRAADLVLLNKTDLHPEEEIRAAEAVIRDIQPEARIQRTVRCDVRFDLFPASSVARSPEGSYALCRDPLFQSLHVLPGPEADPGALRTLLAREAKTIYRLKGVLEMPAGRMRLDFSAGGLSEEPAGNADPSRGIVAILAGDAATRVGPVLMDVLDARG